MDKIISQLKGGTRVAVLTGAGISCSSGIPDFRSPGGMFDTLKPELITATAPQRSLMRMDPTTVVDIRLFFCQPVPIPRSEEAVHSWYSAAEMESHLRTFLC